jgi:hypothetical protein
MKKHFIAIAAALALINLGAGAVHAQTVRSEAAEHPRLVAAIRELEGAIAYLESAPHDFGGHKAAAIRDARAAVAQLRLALAYRARRDR